MNNNMSREFVSTINATIMIGACWTEKGPYYGNLIYKSITRLVSYSTHLSRCWVTGSSMPSIELLLRSKPISTIK